MRVGRSGGRAGVTTGDVLIVLAVLSLLFASVYPRLRWRTFQDTVQRAIGDVEAVVGAARAHRAETGAWPSPRPPGVEPAELAAHLPADVSFTSESHTLEWTRWLRVEHPVDPGRDPETDTLPPPPPIVRSAASLTVSSGDEGLLAALLDRYGPTRSFVREGRWTLMVSAPDSEEGGD